MSPSIVDADVHGLATALAPDPDEILEEMDERAERESFPHVGPAVGGWLALLARAADARRVVEFGSGFGYSAYWIARELPADGEVVLTEIDADEIELAETYFERGGLADRATFEHGDALEILADVEGPVDLVLIDHDKERYVEAFELIRDRVPAGGIVAADNAVTAGPIDPADVRGLVEGEERPDASEMTRGVAAYIDRVRRDEAFTSGLLPLGEGLAVSIKR